MATDVREAKYPLSQHERHEPVSHPARVLLVPAQLVLERLVFESRPQHEGDHHAPRGATPSTMAKRTPVGIGVGANDRRIEAGIRDL
jgi:hypothetical protein